MLGSLGIDRPTTCRESVVSASRRDRVERVPHRNRNIVPRSGSIDMFNKVLIVGRLRT